MAQEDDNKAKSIGIIGASFAGLSLANLLQDNELIHCYVLEARSANDDLISYYNGEVRLPCLKDASVRNRLKLSTANVKLNERCTVSRAKILNELGRNVTQIRYQCPIASISIVPEENRYRLIDVHDNSHGPFDKIIVANGVRSPFRSFPFVICIGDARWVQDVFYDFGFTRIQGGGDMAIRVALELEQILARRHWNSESFRHFQPRNTRRTFLICIAVLLLAIFLRRHQLVTFTIYNA
jgi:hypothetical protein